MFLRRHFSTTPWIHHPLLLNSSSKPKETTTSSFMLHFRYILLLIISLSTCFLSLSSLSFSTTSTTPTPFLPNSTSLFSPPAACRGSALLYVYDLPPEFTVGLLRDCTHLNVYTDMCPHVANHGLGQPLSPHTNWFSTHQFLAEMIFHGRLLNHPCRTLDPTKANLFYIPFYAGLHVSSKFREANLTARDELAVKLVDFIVKEPWWQKNHGKDHFLALGRTAWDFMRTESGPDFGANCLLNLPPVKNMSVLTVERQPWQGRNQYGIPYASYFHPSTAAQMITWQQKMKESNRPYLFSFIGGPRKGVKKAAVREELIKQCNESSRCMLLKCGTGAGKCHEPWEVLKVMSESQFCLQAPGDSFTRRSVFDSVLAGCIPVFFSVHTAYTQYRWYLPAEASEYSVYMEGEEVEKGNIGIERELLKIRNEKVEKMRSKIIELTPSVTYAHPNSFVGFKDAVDVALDALSDRVGSQASIS